MPAGIGEERYLTRDILTNDEINMFRWNVLPLLMIRLAGKITKFPGDSKGITEIGRNVLVRK